MPVGATGTLQAVTTVQVGTQVSGIVQELYADFNSIVKKGQVIARLDPSMLQTQVETAGANLTNARGQPGSAEGRASPTRSRSWIASKELVAKACSPRSTSERRR